MNPTYHSNVDVLSTTTWLDWTVFFLVLAATFASVLYGEFLKKKSEKIAGPLGDTLELLLMGRQLTLPLFVGTMVATWYGGIFGVTQIAFEKGIYNFITQGAFWYVSYIVFALFLVDKIDSYQALTLPDLVHKMYGPRSSKICAILNFLNVLPVAYVLGVGIFIQIITGWPMIASMGAGVIVVILYSSLGGLRAMVFSDLVLFVAMCASVLMILVFSVGTFGGLPFLKANLPANHFSPTGGESIWHIMVWGLIAFSTLVEPAFYQQCFAAKNKTVAKKGILISTLIWFCFDICTTFGAMYARAVIPEANSGHSYLIYALQLLPDGLRGFALAGILATIISTLDSYLFIASTTLTYDLGPKKIRGAAWAHHLGVAVISLFTILLATRFEGSIKSVWKTFGSYSASCLLLPVLVGYITKRKLHDFQFICAVSLGILAVTYWRFTKHTGIWADVDEIYIGVTATLTGLFIIAPILIHFFPNSPLLSDKENA